VVQSTRHEPSPPYVEDLTIKDSFADGCAGLTFSNGNLHATFITITADHSQDPAPLKRVVSARIVMPIGAAIELRDTITSLLEKLIQQGLITIASSGATPSVPTGRPH
jgi:hypothetical protein